MSAATPAEWVAFLSLGVGVHASLSVPYFLAVDADLADFDPRPAVARSKSPLWQAAVHAGHDVNRMTATAQHAFLALLFPASEATR